MIIAKGKELMVSNLMLRIISGVCLASMAVAAICIGGLTFQFLMFSCIILMLFEWFSISKNCKSKVLKISAPIYIIVPMIYWILISIFEQHATVKKEIVTAFAIVWSCDIFAYFGGRLLKGPKLAPNISPNKTWSGAIVGAAATCFLFYVIDINNKLSIVALLLLIVSSILGDLLESKVKRYLNVKDTSNLIPGHGGILDRLDSFLLVSYIFIVLKIIASCK